MTGGARGLAALAALLAAPSAGAHEVLHEVERGRAVAVRAYESDGEALAGARYEVYSPADPASPWQAGRTDRNGWLAFVPDAAGKWRVRVVEDAGHGLDVLVDTAAPVSSAPPSTAALVLRPLLGLAAVGAVFAVLVVVARRRRPGP